jgi:hypothetical protein
LWRDSRETDFSTRNLLFRADFTPCECDASRPGYIGTEPHGSDCGTPAVKQLPRLCLFQARGHPARGSYCASNPWFALSRTQIGYGQICASLTGHQTKRFNTQCCDNGAAGGGGCGGYAGNGYAVSGNRARLCALLPTQRRLWRTLKDRSEHNIHYLGGTGQGEGVCEQITVRTHFKKMLMLLANVLTNGFHRRYCCVVGEGLLCSVLRENN